MALLSDSEPVGGCRLTCFEVFEDPGKPSGCCHCWWNLSFQRISLVRRWRAAPRTTAARFARGWENAPTANVVSLVAILFRRYSIRPSCFRSLGLLRGTGERVHFCVTKWMDRTVTRVTFPLSTWKMNITDVQPKTNSAGIIQRCRSEVVHRKKKGKRKKGKKNKG